MPVLEHKTTKLPACNRSTRRDRKNGDEMDASRTAADTLKPSWQGAMTTNLQYFASPPRHASPS
jgi:hypothetical protein